MPAGTRGVGFYGGRSSVARRPPLTFKNHSNNGIVYKITYMTVPPYIWHFKGRQPGPTVVVLGGTHGDELTGIAVVRELLKKFGLLSLQAGTFERDDINGDLYFGFGNPEAIMRGTRAASVRDLNRSFSSDQLDAPAVPSDSLDLQRARELAPLFCETDFLFDIHGTSNASPAFVCSECTPDHAALYLLMPVQSVLSDSRGILAQQEGINEIGTTDFFVDTHGGSEWSMKKQGKKQGVGMCYETGLATDLSKVTETHAIVLRLLDATGVITEAFLKQCGTDRTTLTAIPQVAQQRFELSNCIAAQHTSFVYASGMDRGWQQVSKGQLLGHYSSGEEVHIERDGMLLFPKAAHKIVVGKSLYYLADPV